MTGEQPGDYKIDIQTTVPGDVGVEADEVRHLRSEADRKMREATDRTVKAVHALRNLGLSLRDAAQVLGISYQRAHQITAETQTTGRKTVAQNAKTTKARRAAKTPRTAKGKTVVSGVKPTPANKRRVDA
jgi:molybdenum-dependent DNA-binding transcriptional regulator ModE